MCVVFHIIHIMGPAIISTSQDIARAKTICLYLHFLLGINCLCCLGEFYAYSPTSPFPQSGPHSSRWGRHPSSRTEFNGQAGSFRERRHAGLWRPTPRYSRPATGTSGEQLQGGNVTDYDGPNCRRLLTLRWPDDVRLFIFVIFPVVIDFKRQDGTHDTSITLRSTVALSTITNATRRCQIRRNFYIHLPTDVSTKVRCRIFYSRLN